MQKIIAILLSLLPVFLLSSCSGRSGMATPQAKNCSGAGAADVVASITRLDVSDAEIPVIDYVCPNASANVKYDPVHGVIAFDGDVVTLRFRLGPSLLHTHWKAKSDDSVRMIPISDASNIPLPDRHDWCGTPKHITVSKNEMSFPLCPDDGRRHMYEYELHMDQTGTDQYGNAVTVDVAIDPQIVHHPTSDSG
jgi:hypothetical protein